MRMVVGMLCAAMLCTVSGCQKEKVIREIVTFEDEFAGGWNVVREKVEVLNAPLPELNGVGNRQRDVRAGDFVVYFNADHTGKSINSNRTRTFTWQACGERVISMLNDNNEREILYIDSFNKTDMVAYVNGKFSGTYLDVHGKEKSYTADARYYITLKKK